MPAAATNSTGQGGILAGADPDALKVVRRLLSAGHEAYLVGGCVRDLYLGLRPKDFDIATSATPENIRRLFRNSRIIGRRFKLAHVFFGPKIIETSTFRTAPTQTGDDDPLITHDNEWGSVEDDARRRDFTINGLFFDVESEKIVDFVDGMDDLDDRLIRTIGDPEVRFREDPVRMIRAVKFAARLGFRIEDETWSALLEVAPDIAKCSQARVLEEIYKLLRGGASRGSFEMMLDAGLLQHLMGRYVELYGSPASPDAPWPLHLAARDETVGRVEPPPAPESADKDQAANGSGEPTDGDGDEPENDDDDAPPPAPEPPPGPLLWRYLGALDDYVGQTSHVVSNGVIQAVLFAPLISQSIAASSRQSLDRIIDELMTPVCASLGVARRDRELARQIIMAYRRMTDLGMRRRRRSSLTQRQYFHDALIFLGMAVGAQQEDGGQLAHWKRLAEAAKSSGNAPAPSGRRRRRRGRRKRNPGRSTSRRASGDG